MTQKTVTGKKPKQQAFSTINTKAFLSVVAILVSILLLSGVLSYFIPQGAYERDSSGAIVLNTYVQQDVSGIPFWRVVTAWVFV